MVHHPTPQVSDVFPVTEQGSNVCSKALPTEIILKIIALLGRTELLSLACTNSIFRVEAERPLYQSINFEAYHSANSSILKCFESLQVKNRALLVKSFSLSLRSFSEFSEAILQSLCDCLLLMSSLTRLKLKFSSVHSEYVSMMLEPCLCRCVFSLTTLFLSETLVERVRPWVLSQKGLETFIIHDESGLPTPENLSMYRQLHNQSTNRFTLFRLFRIGTTEPDTVDAFPAFSQQWNAGRIIGYNFITNFTIFIKTLSDDERLRQVVLSILEHFPMIHRLSVHVEDGAVNANHETLASILSLFPLLEEFNVRNWEHSPDDATVHPSFEGRTVELAKIWSSQCREMGWVGFPDSSKCIRDNGMWKIRGR